MFNLLQLGINEWKINILSSMAKLIETNECRWIFHTGGRVELTKWEPKTEVMLEPTALRAPEWKTSRKGTSKRGKRKRDREEDRDEGRHKVNRAVWEVQRQK